MSKSSPSEAPGPTPPRVRIAPSPTGDPHVGTAYVALFNYAFARRHGGRFVLRIEDTDRERSTSSSEAAIFEALRWLGLSWDEGPDVGGEYGPYRQSERAQIYREHAELLIGSGHAYPCFCTRERLDEVRKQQTEAKATLGYDGHCRGLDRAQGAQRMAGGEAHTIRLAVPKPGRTTFVDRLRGEVSFDHEQVDDQVLLKSDGHATYHLANVVDDHLMGITHVIRGEDWLSSTPKHVLLYDAFGWSAPHWYHVGLLRNFDKSKLSKRKNPVSIHYYRDLGYLPTTFLNFLGTLGYSMEDGRERFTLEEFVDAFDLGRLSAGGPVFDPVKLRSFNADDIRAMPMGQLQETIAARVLPADRLAQLLVLSQERIDTLDDFVPYVAFFFGGSVDYAPVASQLRVKKRTTKDSAKIIGAWVDAVEKDAEAREFTAGALESFSRRFCEEHAWKPKELFTLLRVGATGRTAAPPLFDTLSVLGKDRVRLRLREVAVYLRTLPDA